MPGAATVNRMGQKSSVLVLRSSMETAVDHGIQLAADVSPNIAFDTKRVMPTTLAAMRNVLPIVRAQRGLGSLGNSQTNCHKASERNASQYSGSSRAASVENAVPR